jgi:AhpD family alkylhydroperoxidase
MRITPIEPRNPILRLLNRMIEWTVGKPITPLRVMLARFPRAIAAQLGIYWGLAGRQKIEPELQLLLQGHVAALNRCGFCVDIGRALATYRGLTLDKLDAVADWRTSSLFDARERAALAYVEEATRSRHVTDETFAALRAHFDEDQIVAITWLNAVENYFNLLNAPLGIGSDGLCAIAEQRRPRRARTTRPPAASAA